MKELLQNQVLLLRSWKFSFSLLLKLLQHLKNTVKITCPSFTIKRKSNPIFNNTTSCFWHQGVKKLEARRDLPIRNSTKYQREHKPQQEKSKHCTRRCGLVVNEVGQELKTKKLCEFFPSVLSLALVDRVTLQQEMTCNSWN